MCFELEDYICVFNLKIKLDRKMLRCPLVQATLGDLSKEVPKDD